MRADLVDRARNGDREAFEQLVSPSFDQFFRTARLILRDDERAADAMQDAMLSAWLHVRAVRDHDRFEAWMRRLVVNACYVEARRSGRRRAMEMQITPLEAPVTEDAQRTTATRDQLERGFRHLTIEQRAVLVVHHYLGLSDLEAATALDVPLGTYKSRLNRATAAMRAGLEADNRAPLRAKESIA
jgi:RNA polymerase sigma-70 factor (ECF subfamily)